jgi:O-antigen/teichoic acid export membrane protein
VTAADSNLPHETTPESVLFLKNSAASVVIGASSAIMSLAVPPVLARVLPPATFAVWALVLQIAGYTAILGLGLQDAVGRYVAFHEERRDAAARDAFVSASLWVLCFMAVIAATGIGLAAWFLERMFPQIPHDLLPIAKGAVLATGLTLAFALPFTVFNGTLIGLRHNFIVAAVVGTTRLLLTLSLIVVALKFRSLYLLAVCFVTVSIASYAAIWICCRRFTAISPALRKPDRRTLQEIWSYCSATAIWQIGALMISGLDVFIVGRVDFADLPYYTVCLVPITVLAGVMPALFGPLMQVGAKYAARGDDAELGRILLRSTRLATVAMVSVALALIVFDREILTVWLGEAYAVKAAPILRLIVLGHALRQLAFPYATLLLAAKKHNQLLLSPLVEGVTNVVVAVIAGRAFGAQGVATAVIVGAVVAQLLNYFYNLPRTHGSTFDRWALLSKAILRPMLCFLPLTAWPPLAWLHLPEPVSIAIRFTLLLASWVLVWNVAIERDERGIVWTLLSRGRSQVRRSTL